MKSSQWLALMKAGKDPNLPVYTRVRFLNPFYCGLKWMYKRTQRVRNLHFEISYNSLTCPWGIRAFTKNDSACAAQSVEYKVTSSALSES